MTQNTPPTPYDTSRGPETEELELSDDVEDQDTQSHVSSVLITLFLIAFLSPLGSLWWSSIGHESPWSPLQTRDAGTVLEVSYLHGLGTRTLIKTSNDLLLLEHAVRIQVGTPVVLQSNAFAERLCIHGSDACWYVVNR